jgi:flagellar basal body P-ring protein FlgI
MKFVQYLASFAVVSLVLSLSAFAKDSHSGKFTLSDTVQVGSAQLSPGDYKVEWNGSANNVKIEIIKNGKTVATADGQIKNLQQPAPYNAVLTKTMQDNTKQLNEIDFDKRSEALVLGGE